MAIKTVSVEATQVEGFKIETKSRQHIAYVDQPVAGGGSDAGPTPLEYLFVSLAGCIVTIGIIIAKQKRLPITGITAHVEGDLETDVFMGKTDEIRAGFSAISVHVKVDADMSKKEKEAFVKEVDSRCPISDNILKTTPIKFEVE